MYIKISAVARLAYERMETMVQGLKPKEKLVLDYITEKLDETGYAPSVRDICAELNIKSTSTAQMYIEKLEAKGYLYKEQGKSRTLRVVRPGGEKRRYSVPILGQVAAGIPILTVENFDGYIEYSTEKHFDKDALFALKVKGESMKDCGILDGDYVVIDHRSNADDGEIIAAMIEGEATVKVFYKKDGKFILEPRNPAFSPIVVESVDVIGKVIANFRLYN